VGASLDAVDAALHLAIFLAAGLAIGAFALAVLDRLTGEGPDFVGWRWPVIASGAFAALLTAERLFHMLV
jgi:hypothetical protein